MSELTEHLRHIGCLNKPRCIESADLLDAQATELARLREQVVAQQARIVEFRDVLELVKRDAPHNIPYYAFGDNEAACEMSRKLENIEGYGDQVLATTDDLSALKQHDDALWNEALTRGVEWQATRGHTLDADDYENELRSLKR